MILKEKLNLTDEETAEQIRENHYMQFFIGFEGYRYERPFEASMKTFSDDAFCVEVIAEINELIARRLRGAGKAAGNREEKIIAR
ncbi:MAG: transposase [Candidatus Moduliflexus flocculans]|nr:transposase [Candidatus Moduliflexus flocculans]